MIYIGIDPGLSGAVCVLDGNNVTIFEVPTAKQKNGKDDYLISEMANFLETYRNNSVICVIENVFSMTGQGVSSSFNFGRGKGIWEGIAHSMGFDVHMVSPQTWKKFFPILQAEKVEIPQILKDKPPRTAKEKEVYKEIKRDYERQKRLSKSGAKTKARELASSLYPSLADQFKRVNSDGKAEALLICEFAKANLVSRKGSKKCRKKKK
jgi:crossover junction endodeoxyribonuclease RuvC